MSPARMPDQQEQHELILNLRKPIGWTSNDVVRFVKRRFPGKVGHAGTLDPFADGVLLVCLGKATKQVPELMLLEKEYHAVLELGTETDTLDISGNILKQESVLAISAEQVLQVMPRFIGEIEQEPPVFSALRVNGMRAYQLARQGEKVKLKSRRVKIHSLDLLDIKDNRLRLAIRCSKGTYIRALARDLAAALGTVGYVRTLTRTRVGDYIIEKAESLTQLKRR